MIRARVRLALIALLVSLIACLGSPAVALAETDPQLHEAQAAIVVDGNGDILWGMNEHDRMPMASITKVMTAMVALDSGIPMDTVVDIDDPGMPDYSQLCGLKAGTQATFRDLMLVMLVFSANDAAVEIGRAVAGSDEAFVELMNAKAAEIGMVDTHFCNPHGLEEEGHYSSAADLALMGRYAMENYPFIAETVHLRSVEVTINGEPQTFDSTDALLGDYPGARGIKTGKTEFGSAFLGACSRSSLPIYSVVLGCATDEGRWDDTRALWNWAYGTHYHQRTFYEGDVVQDVIPFAYHFGQYVTVSYVTDVAGFVDPAGGDVSYRSVSARRGLLAETNQEYGAIIYTQGHRIVAAGTMRTSSDVVFQPQYDPTIPRLCVGL